MLSGTEISNLAWQLIDRLIPLTQRLGLCFDDMQDALLHTFATAVEEATDRSKPKPLEQAFHMGHLYVIARNKLLDIRSVRNRETPLLDNDHCRSLSHRHAGKETDRAEAIQAALSKLKPRDRELIILRYIEGVPQHIIAERLGLAESSLCNRLTKARMKLQLLLTQAGIGPEDLG